MSLITKFFNPAIANRELMHIVIPALSNPTQQYPGTIDFTLTGEYASHLLGLKYLFSGFSGSIRSLDIGVDRDNLEKAVLRFEEVLPLVPAYYKKVEGGNIVKSDKNIVTIYPGRKLTLPIVVQAKNPDAKSVKIELPELKITYPQ